MKIIYIHIFHQPKVLLVTGIITRCSTLQGRFIGEIRRIADAPEKDRGVSFKIKQLCTSDHKSGRSRSVRG